MDRNKALFCATQDCTAHEPPGGCLPGLHPTLGLCPDCLYNKEMEAMEELVDWRKVEDEDYTILEVMMKEESPEVWAKRITLLKQGR